MRIEKVRVTLKDDYKEANRKFLNLLNLSNWDRLKSIVLQESASPQKPANPEDELTPEKLLTELMEGKLR